MLNLSLEAIIASRWTVEEVEAATRHYTAQFLERNLDDAIRHDDGEDRIAQTLDLTEQAFSDKDIGLEPVKHYGFVQLMEALASVNKGKMPNMRTFEARKEAEPKHWGEAKPPALVTEDEYDD